MFPFADDTRSSKSDDPDSAGGAAAWAAVGGWDDVWAWPTAQPIPTSPATARTWTTLRNIGPPILKSGLCSQCPARQRA